MGFENPSALPHPWIEDESLRRADTDVSEALVEGIQKIVGLVGDDGGRDGQHQRLSFAQPSRSKLRQSLGRWLISPVSAEVRRSNLRDRERGRDVG